MNYESLIEIGEKSIFVVMGIASIIAIAVIVERAIVFFKNIKDSNIVLPDIIKTIRSGELADIKDSNIVLPDIIKTIRSGELAEAKKFLQSYPENVYARFANFSAEHSVSGKESLSELMEGQTIGERVSFETRLSILNTLGNNAPFIGLLGTVFGVINAFYKLGTLGNTGADVVMRTISTALLATAVGLGVAIPVVMANNYFTRKLKIIQSNLDILSREFLASLSRNK